MAAYPFQQMSMKKLKRLSRSIKEPKHNVDTQRLRKDYNLPDKIVSKVIRPASDQSSNHPQTDNS
jgi:hypothetical protein